MHIFNDSTYRNAFFTNIRNVNKKGYVYYNMIKSKNNGFKLHLYEGIIKYILVHSFKSDLRHTNNTKDLNNSKNIQ